MSNISRDILARSTCYRVSRLSTTYQQQHHTYILYILLLYFTFHIQHNNTLALLNANCHLQPNALLLTPCTNTSSSFIIFHLSFVIYSSPKEALTNKPGSACSSCVPVPYHTTPYHSYIDAHYYHTSTVSYSTTWYSGL